jgi:AcrR family transcriptional regulator
MSDTELRSRILEAAKENFFNNGFSKITMEEFAHSMGMSKKTIYKFFQSKDDLVREITREKLQTIHAGCTSCQQDATKDFFTRIKNATHYISTQMQSMKPQFYLDIHRSMPDLWKEIDEFRNERIRTDFRNMILEGIDLGVFRRDVNIDVLTLMYENTMQSIINPQTLSTLPLNASQAYDAIVEIIFGGVFTPEAKEKYSQASHVSTDVQEVTQS